MTLAMLGLSAVVVSCLIWCNFRVTAIAGMLILVGTVGYVQGHPTVEPMMPLLDGRIIGMENGDTYCREGCPVMARQITFVSEEAAKQLGRRPCRCLIQGSIASVPPRQSTRGQDQ